VSRRDNHPHAATDNPHPDCRAPLIQIVAPHLSEIGIGINTVAKTSVADLALERFDLVISLGLPKLVVAHHQMAISWMEPMLLESADAPDLVRTRRVRDALLPRIHALGAILSATNRA
jgi:hypothetical protein